MAAGRESMLTLVKRCLSREKGTWPTVAAGSGVPYGTVTKIALGHVQDPRISTVQALYDYFDDVDRSANLLAPMRCAPCMDATSAASGLTE